MCAIIQQENALRTILTTWLTNWKAHIRAVAHVSPHERLLAIYLQCKRLTEKFILYQKNKTIDALVVTFVGFLVLCFGVCFAIAWVLYRHYQRFESLKIQLEDSEKNVTRYMTELQTSKGDNATALSTITTQKTQITEYRVRNDMMDRRMTALFKSHIASNAVTAAQAAAAQAAAAQAAAGGGAAGEAAAAAGGGAAGEAAAAGGE